MDRRRFLNRFNAWPQTLFPDTLATLEAIPSGIRRVLLSNKNAAHWERQEISGALVGIFDLEFLSFRPGMLKPDRETFDQVREGSGCEPGDILFFDDNPANVSTARSLGMKAHLSKGPETALRLFCRR
jgi:putative hydrolase of the HAD superfamily